MFVGVNHSAESYGGFVGIFGQFLYRKARSAKASSKPLPDIGESTQRRRSTSKKPLSIDFSSAEYIPLPPSPQYWEARQGQMGEHYRFSSSTCGRQILHTYSQKRFNKVVELADGMPQSDLTGEVGEIVLKAYRKIIVSWAQRDRPRVALKWSTKMMERLSPLITDSDRTRHNKLIGKLDSQGIKHEYQLCSLQQPTKARTPVFHVPEWCQWEVKDLYVLHPDERPDPAFGAPIPVKDGTFFVDAKGKSQMTSEGKACVIKLGRTGEVQKVQVLSHDIYRISANLYGTGLITLSSDSELILYDSDLQQIHVEPLGRIAQSKTHIRSLHVSPDGKHFLHSVVDRAWCTSLIDEKRWSVITPPTPGWERVAASGSFSLNEDVAAALDLMSMSYPITFDTIKSRYKALVKQWHPDLNPGKLGMNEKMVQLNAAFEVLTQTDPHLLAEEVREEVLYKKVLGRERFTTEYGEFEMEFAVVGPGEDWIYALGFSTSCEDLLLGTYSGRIVQLDKTAKAKRVFDVGAPPRRIVDTEQYLYITTDTRLYIIEDERCCRVLDVFRKGDLFFTENGFGVLDKKCLLWFARDGEIAGEFHSRDPIRRVYCTEESLVVETRQHRVRIPNAPIWWEHMTRQKKDERQ